MTRKYKHKKTGAIAEVTSSIKHYRIKRDDPANTTSHQILLLNDMVENSNDWEEILPKKTITDSRGISFEFGIGDVIWYLRGSTSIDAVVVEPSKLPNKTVYPLFKSKADALQYLCDHEKIYSKQEIINALNKAESSHYDGTSRFYKARQILGL